MNKAILSIVTSVIFLCLYSSDPSTTSPPSTSSPTTPGPSAIKAACFTPASATTSSVKVESCTGYTPIANTPVRPLANQSITTTPMIARIDGANSTTIPNTVSTVRNSVADPPNMATTGSLVHQDGQTTQVAPGTLPSLQDTTNTFAPEQNKLNQTAARVGQGSSAKSSQSAPGSVVSTGVNVQSSHADQHQAPSANSKEQILSKTGPVSLKTPSVERQTELSPEQGGPSHHDTSIRIPTPKAKLNFAGDGGKRVGVATPIFNGSSSASVYAKKLQKFAFKDRSGKLSEKVGPSKLYAFIDITKDDDQSSMSANKRDIPITDDCKEKVVAPETSHAQRVEQERMQFNQTPPLFDSEYTASTEETVIPESPERTSPPPAEVLRENEVRVRKRKLDDADAGEGAASDDVVEVKQEAGENKEKAVQEDVDGPKAKVEEKPPGRSSRRGRLSRRHSGEKRTLVTVKHQEHEATSTKQGIL